MSVLSQLARTYDENADKIGVLSTEGFPLLPIFHTAQNAHIEIEIDAEGNLIPQSGRVVDKKDSVTIIPCTPSSGGRTRSLKPHPLFDNLKYMAGDYNRFTGDAGGYHLYLETLSRWCASPTCPQPITSILKYVQKGTLISDLVAEGLLHLTDDGTLASSWKGAKKDTPPIYKVIQDPWKSLVRITVDGKRLWEDPEIWQNWINYRNKSARKKDLCCISGNYEIPTTNAPKRIRTTNDNAKMISFMNWDNLTPDAKQAVIGRNSTEKAHNMLKWLISNQGYRDNGLAIVAWSNRWLPKNILFLDTYDLTIALEDFVGASVHADFPERFLSAIEAYEATIMDSDTVGIIALDSIVDGRLSVTFSRHMHAREFWGKIKNWHTQCVEWQMHALNSLGEKTTWVKYYGAPAISQILEFANQPDRGAMRKHMTHQLISCIVDGLPFPAPLAHDIARRETLLSGKDKACCDWLLPVAAAVIRKYYLDHGVQA